MPLLCPLPILPIVFCWAAESGWLTACVTWYFQTSARNNSLLIVGRWGSCRLLSVDVDRSIYSLIVHSCCWYTCIVHACACVCALGNMPCFINGLVPIHLAALRQRAGFCHALYHARDGATSAKVWQLGKWCHQAALCTAVHLARLYQFTVLLCLSSPVHQWLYPIIEGLISYLSDWALMSPRHCWPVSAQLVSLYVKRGSIIY